MQRIEIQNFGPIKNVELDIKDYTIFIGPQASGKSTITRAIHFFRTLGDALIMALSPIMNSDVDCVDVQSFYDEIEKRFFEIWDRSYLHSDTFIKFVYDEESKSFIEIRQKDGDSLLIKLSKPLMDKFPEIDKEAASIKEKTEKLTLPAALIPLMINQTFDNLFSSTLSEEYIPAGRTIFSAIRNELTPGFDSMFNDVLIYEYIPKINAIRKWMRRQNQRPIEIRLWEKKGAWPHAAKMYPFITAVLHGEYQSDNDQDYICTSEKRIPLTSTSSGQQESLWILLSAMRAVWEPFLEGSFTVIEEPESHLFPKAQQNMMHVLTFFANYPNNKLMLTTHSPYILTPLNNFLFAHELGQDESKRAAVAQIVDPDLWINPERFDCFYVDNGTITSVMDREVNMMNLEKLDSASQIGNEEYDKLSALEG